MARSFQTWRAPFTFDAAGTTVHRLLLSVMYCSGQPDEQSTDSSPDDVNFDSQSTKAKAVALSPAKAAYFRSSTSQTSAPYIFEFIEYRGVTTGAHGLVESFIFRVDYGPKHGKAQMRMRVTNFPENCIPSEERASVQEHLNKAVSLIPQRERDYLRRKYRLDVTGLLPSNAQPNPNSKSSPEQPSAYERPSPMALQEAQPPLISVIEAYKRGLSFGSYRRVSKLEGQQHHVIVSADGNHGNEFLVSIPIEIDASALDEADRKRLQIIVHGIDISDAGCKELREARIDTENLFNVLGADDG